MASSWSLPVIVKRSLIWRLGAIPVKALMYFALLPHALTLSFLFITLTRLAKCLAPLVLSAFTFRRIQSLAGRIPLSKRHRS